MDTDIRTLIFLIVLVFVGVLMIPIMQGFIGSLSLTGTAGDVIGFSIVFFALALVIPFIAWGVNKVD